MPYKRVVKVSDEVYAELRKIMSEYGFPSPNQAIVFLLSVFECFEVVLKVRVGGETPYYVLCPECSMLAHFLRSAGKAEWYYCPKCNKVFRVESG